MSPRTREQSAAAVADAPEQAAAEEPTQEIAPAQEQEQESVETPAPAPSRKALAQEQAQAAQASVDPKSRYKLAPALDGSPGEWHDTPGGGHVAITRHESQAGEQGRVTVTDYVTYIGPRARRVQSIPLFALFEHPEL